MVVPKSYSQTEASLWHCLANKYSPFTEGKMQEVSIANNRKEEGEGI